MTGPVEATTAHRYWRVVLASGIQAAPLHLGTELIPESVLAAFKER